MVRFRLRIQDREIAIPEGGELVVGRDATCGIALDDRLVSRRHAAFRATTDGVEVVDLGSTNGVRINDALIVGTGRAGHRDRVQVGSHVFVLLDSDRETQRAADTARALSVRPTPARPEFSAAGTPLGTIARFLVTGDVQSAASNMDAVLGRYSDRSEILEPGELGRVVTLLIELCDRTQQGRYLERVFQIYTARVEVPDGWAIDALQEAIARCPSFAATSIETYLEAMQARSAALSTQEQVRLRRVSTLARRAQKPSTSS